MDYSNEDNSKMWDWQCQDFVLEDNTNTEISQCLLDGVNCDEDHMSCMFDNATTPVRACGDSVYFATDSEAMVKELDQCREPSSQVKRRRMLHFEPEVLDTPLCNDEVFLKSKETRDCLEDVISEMSQWVAGFAEGTSASNNDYLDPSPDGWIADCFNDAEMHFSTEDISSISGASDVQIDITEFCNTSPENDAKAAENQPTQTEQNMAFKGRKSYIPTPPKAASVVAYPFTFIKPCGVLGGMTLKDINQRILAPPKSQQDEADPCVVCPTSAFSGKPVVGKTKIRTEGGEGSITIVRTKG